MPCSANASRIVWEANTEGGERLATSTLNLRAGTLGPITQVPALVEQDEKSRREHDARFFADARHAKARSAEDQTAEASTAVQVRAMRRALPHKLVTTSL